MVLAGVSLNADAQQVVNGSENGVIGENRGAIQILRISAQETCSCDATCPSVRTLSATP
jgi:hypothetical protein